MRISVAVAVRNGERYLQQLLDSLLRQTKRPDEVVVSDDASEDATPRLLEAFAAEAPFPVCIERFGERRGHVEGFMRAARRCRGDAIAFCDADDVWAERKLEVCAKALAAPGTTLVLHTARVVDATLRDLGREWPAIRATRLVPPLALTGLDVDAPGMAMVVRRDVLSIADFEGRPPSRYGLGRRMLHDEWVLFLAGVLGPVQLLAEPLVDYRQHGENDSGGWVDRRRRLTLRPSLDDYRHAAAHTAACADYLDRTPAEGLAAERLAAGARAYRCIAANWELRAAMHCAGDFRERARILRRLLAAGAYRDRAGGGFGRAAVGKDLAGVVIGSGARA